MALPVTITGLSTAVASVGPFKVAAGSTNTLMLATGGTGTNSGNFNATTAQARGQTFTNGGSSLRIDALTIKLSKTGNPTDNFFCEVRATNNAGALLATSDSISLSSIPTAQTDTTFTFASPATISASATFGISFKRSGAPNVSNFPSVGNTIANVYAGGSEQIYDGSAWFDTSAQDAWVQLYTTTVIAADAYYLFGRNGTTATTLSAYKSTAPDTSWASIATKTGFTTAILALSAYQMAHVIHLLVQDGTVSTAVATKYVSYNAETDTFLATTETVSAAVATTGQGGGAGCRLLHCCSQQWRGRCVLQRPADQDVRHVSLPRLLPAAHCA